jgi:hypothetical protein
MAVDVEISRQHVRDELDLVKELAAAQKWEIAPNYAGLVVTVTMFAHDDDRYIVEFRCDNYKEMPPFIEFIDPDTGERGTRHAYPKGNDSFFHDSGPCICAPFSRKAYKAIVATGPHGDWNFGDWQISTANGVQWSNASKIGDMLGLIYRRISRPDLYKGRMQ